MDRNDSESRPIALADLPLDDDPSSGSMPEDVARELDRRLLDVYDGDRRVAIDELADAMRAEGETDTIPTQFAQMPRARRIETVRDASQLSVDRSDGASFRPAWSSLAYRPRLGDVPRIPSLKASRGRLVRPLVDEMVFGNEDREPFIPNAWPWTCVGKLTTFLDGRKFSGGTATLVGTRTIATAAHTMPRQAWTGGNWSAEFKAAWYCASSLVGSGGSSWVTDGFGYRDHEAGNDMVVLRLERPLGSWVGFFGFRTYDDDWEDDAMWTHVGYPVALGMGDLPYRQGGISVYDDDDGPDDSVELQHYGDMGRGDSGGPLFGWWPLGPYLVGVMSGNYQAEGFLGIGGYNHNVHAGGEALTRLCAHGRANWT